MSKICVSLTASGCHELAALMNQAAEAGISMVELRLDWLTSDESINLASLATQAQLFPGEVITTCRLKEEGGYFTGPEDVRLNWLTTMAAGSDYIDLEYEAWQRSELLRSSIAQLRNADSKSGPEFQLILSKHDFEKTPDNLEQILDEMADTGGDVVKLACQANEITDSLRILDALRSSSEKRPTIALAMGEAGMMTRVLAGKCGGLLTFASMETGKESAPGQLTADEMLKQFRVEGIGPATSVYGVIGCPVSHSMSPAIFNAAFGKLEIDAVYLPMRVEPEYEAFEAFVDGCRQREWLHLGGCSVTIPHKQNLLQYVRSHDGFVEPLADRIGAANTLSVARSQQAEHQAPVSAHNTDYRGVLGALCEGMGITQEALADKVVAVLGAGGVSRAIVAGLRDSGAAVDIYNRTHAKAEALASEFGATAKPIESRESHQADIVINGTSIGMLPDVDSTPMPAAGLANRPVVFDTVYNPMKTRLLQEAEEAGCTTVDGVAMFVLQAAAQFQLWRHSDAPVEIMRQVVVERLSATSS